MPIPSAVIGASGYTGAELLRLLADHDEIDVRVVTAG
ncbi:MAG: N-acetyl-gamma-glutamyl-phosphate reductase, partial [Actinobacteria bacterium ATB1]|nr:N-acetyl-gamma-glutamyl-phosphate reductase [Actinobacteria bacterium ATB1]